MKDIIISAENLVKKYVRGSEEVYALRNVSLQIHRGEFVSFVGPSGSGKTTLINILGCLDNPTSGNLFVGSQEVFSSSRKLSEPELTRVRREFFGYIFQSFYLIPTLTVYENTVLPFAFYKKDIKVEEVLVVLDMLGIKKRMHHLPKELSGGEMQRVAIARALVNKPTILLADEPTGNLDVKRSSEIGELLVMLNKKEDLTIIMVTHNMELSKKANLQLTLRDGSLI